MTNSYVFSPSLADFSDTLSSAFYSHFQFFRINTITVKVENPLPVGGNNASVPLQIPDVVLAPMRNADTYNTFDAAVSATGAVRRLLSTGALSLSMKPCVPVTNGQFVVSPMIDLRNTTGPNQNHYGINIFVERGGTGYTFDLMFTTTISVSFLGFDGS